MPFHQYRIYVSAEELGFVGAAAFIDLGVYGGYALLYGGFVGGGGVAGGAVGYEEGVFGAGDGVAVDVVYRGAGF